MNNKPELQCLAVYLGDNLELVLCKNYYEFVKHTDNPEFRYGRRYYYLTLDQVKSMPALEALALEAELSEKAKNNV